MASVKVHCKLKQNSSEGISTPGKIEQTKPSPYLWQKLAILPTHLWPDQEIWYPVYRITVVVCTVTIHISYEGLLLMVLSIMMNWKVLLKTTFYWVQDECKIHAPFMTKLTKTDTPFMTKTAEQPHPLGLYIPTEPVCTPLPTQPLHPLPPSPRVEYCRRWKKKRHRLSPEMFQSQELIDICKFMCDSFMTGSSDLF